MGEKLQYIREQLERLGFYVYEPIELQTGVYIFSIRKCLVFYNMHFRDDDNADEFIKNIVDRWNKESASMLLAI